MVVRPIILLTAQGFIYKYINIPVGSPSQASLGC